MILLTHNVDVYGLQTLVKQLPYKYLKDTWVEVGVYNQADWTELHNDTTLKKGNPLLKRSRKQQRQQTTKKKRMILPLIVMLNEI